MVIVPRSLGTAWGDYDRGPPVQTVPSHTSACVMLDHSTSLRLAGTLAWECATNTCPEWALPQAVKKWEVCAGNHL
jgi:hypothetical protein